MRTRARTFVAVLLVACTMSSKTNSTDSMDRNIIVHRIIDFADHDSRQSWSIVNDDVMGGRSTSSMRLVDEQLAEFSGMLSLENNGGFALMRSNPLNTTLEGYDGFLIRVRGDGRSYKFRVRTTTNFDGVSYQREFQTSAGEWTEIVLPFADFVASFRGRLLPDLGPPNASEIKQVGFLLADKRPGPFRLTIAWIAACQLGQSQGNTGMTSEH